MDIQNILVYSLFAASIGYVVYSYLRKGSRKTGKSSCDKCSHQH